MINLKETEYSKINHLAHKTDYNKALIFSILDGSNEGEVLLDNKTNPTAAFISWDFSFLLGSEADKEFSENLCEYIFDTVIPSSQDKEIILFLKLDKWPHLISLLKNKGCITISRKMFDFSPDKFEKCKNSQKNLGNGYALHRIDKAIADKYPKYKEIAYSVSKFGFIITHDDKVVSKCVSVAVGASEAEIDIATDEIHRGKGLAKIAATAFIDHCIKNNIAPVWSCWPEREVSIALANKLGFIESEDVPVMLWTQDI